MKVPLLLAALLISGAAGAVARVGETLDEISNRYGKELTSSASPIAGVTLKSYQYKGLLVVVGFLNGRSIQELYAKANDEKLSENEISILMEANSQGKAWELDQGAVVGKRWTLQDGSVIAEWVPFPDSRLTITTREAAEYAAREKAKKEAANLKGF
jgi:hypothetical protein